MTKSDRFCERFGHLMNDAPDAIKKLATESAETRCQLRLLFTAGRHADSFWAQTSGFFYAAHAFGRLTFEEHTRGCEWLDKVVVKIKGEQA